MPPDREITSASKSATPNRVSFLGPPPLLDGEDPKAYDELLSSVTGAVKPSDVIDEILADDVVNFHWEARRWQQLMASLLTSKMPDALERMLVRPLNLPLEMEYLTPLKPTPAKEL